MSRGRGHGSDALVSLRGVNVPILRSAPNVSAFERMFKDAVKEHAAGSTPSYDAFIKTADSKRPVLFRGVKTVDDFAATVANLCDTLKKDIGVKELKLSGNNNNKDGSDLYEENSGTHIELKLGAATDLNVGVQSISNILGSGLMSHLPTRADRLGWKNLYNDTEASKAAIRSQHRAKLDQFAREYNKLTGTKLSNQAQPIIDAYYRGITSTQNMTDELTGIRRWQLMPDMTWEEDAKSTDIAGQWYYGAASVGAESGRLTFRVLDEPEENILKLVLNYKNRYKHPTYGKIEARLGLGSPSFNGWWESVKALPKEQ